ncbi:MAG: hypothetical protein Q4G65_04240 [bacterium]|nr:hypothetical protein [bacterium]
MAAEDEAIGFLIGTALILFVIVVILYLIVTAFAVIAGAGAMWGLGVSSKNFFVAARRNIGKGIIR